MKKKIYIQFIIFLIAFVLIFIIPKPDLRIEKINHRVNKNLNTLIIGNSILEHQSPCDIKSNSISGIYKDFSVTGEGGLLLEEIFLSLNNNTEKKNLILITAPYQYSQPLYYPLQSHMYYSNKLVNNFGFYNYSVVKNSLWRLDESIIVDGKKINRGEASLIVKKMASTDRCNLQNVNNISLLDEIFKHSSNNFINEDIQFDIIKSLSQIYNLSIILIPVYLDNFNSSASIRLKAANQLQDIEKKLKLIDLKLEVLNINDDITNYDEPWCMCGHLSSKGRIILEKTIATLVNNR